MEHNTILEKIQRNPDYSSWDLHFFTDDYGPGVVNDEPDSTDTPDTVEDCDAESFMSHRVMHAIIAFDVIPNVLKSKWTDVRGTPPIKTYHTQTPDGTSEDEDFFSATDKLETYSFANGCVGEEV